MYDMEYDESFPVDIEKDIKFSLVKMKLPLGSKYETVLCFSSRARLVAKECLLVCLIF